MSYIRPPEPADDVVIWPATDDQPAFTWGDHRRMAAMLEDLEADNPAVAKARERLDEALGLYEKQVVLICEFCWQPENKPHDRDCRDNNDPALWVKREALSYEYLGPDMKPVHLTSVPMTDDEALGYCGIVELMFTGPGPHVKYIMRKALDGSRAMMPWQFDAETWEVREIVRPDN